MKCYRGCRTDGGVLVSVNGVPLDARFDLWNHSPAGFEWGYGGSGLAHDRRELNARQVGEALRAIRAEAAQTGGAQ